MTAPGHPRGLFVLFFTEMWERFSYYGMRSLLMLYMVEALHYSTLRAGTIYGLYTGAVYLTPPVGGYLADTRLGQRRAILWGGLIMAAGHFTLALPWAPALALGLVLIVLGNGLFKPNTTVLVGQLYAAGDPRRDGGFSIFYMGINLGALMSPLICGTLGQRVGWHVGFAAAGVGMLVGLGLYLLGQGHLGALGQRPSRALAPPPPAAPGRRRRRGLDRAQWRAMLVLLALATLGNVAFFAAFEQAGSSMALFAERCTRLRLDALGWSMPSSWFMALNPALIVLLAPAFARLWQVLGELGREPSTPLKFALGLTFVAAGFAVMAAAGSAYDRFGRVSMMWLVVAYLLQTCGELCVSPVGLAAVTKLAPPRYGSLVMGLWLGSFALANALGGGLAGDFDRLSKGAFFSIPALVPALAALALLALARPLQRLSEEVRPPRAAPVS